MEIEKLFIGNLNFEATEDGVKGLLSQYGTIVSIRLSKKKGHAVVEMSEKSEAEAVIKNLDGKRFMERELRISFELDPKKAKTASVKRYSEKKKSFSDGKKDDSSEQSSTEREKGPSRRESQRNSADKWSTTPPSRTRERIKGDSDRDNRGNSAEVAEKAAKRFARETSPRRDSSDGYYSQSFRKRAESSTQSFSKYRHKDNSSESKDDFMRDESGRDYRDSEKRTPGRGGANRGGGFRSRETGDHSGSRRRDDSGTGQGSRPGRSYGDRPAPRSNDDSEKRYMGSSRPSSGERGNPRERSGERPPRRSEGRPDFRTDDRSRREPRRDSGDDSFRDSSERRPSGFRSQGNSAGRSGGSSRPGSSYGSRDRESSPREPRSGSGENSGRSSRPSSGRPSMNSTRSTSGRPGGSSRSGSGSSRGENRNSSQRGESRNRPADRSRNKQR